MSNGKYIGPIEESHTPVQEAAATAEPANKALLPFPVRDLLSEGKENAISAKDLTDLLKMGSVRELQQEIARERAAGAVILSTCQDGGGYYLPATDREVREFIRTLESRGKNTLLALRSARNYLRHAGENGGD